MPKVNVEKFLKLVKSSGLVEEDEFRSAVKTLRQHAGGELPADVEAVADSFVKAELITEWQQKKLLEGRHKGFILGNYKLLRRIGKGGMSSVYLAEHTLIGKMRAIKVLPRKFLSDPGYLESFRHEARVVASLDHPNIVKAFDIDSHGHIHYIVMEYVEGRDLQAIVKEDGVPPFKSAAEYIRQAALGLHHAHEKELIHRDVKPANLLLNEAGQVKLLDLGLAMFSGKPRSPDGKNPQSRSPSDSYVNIGESSSGVHNRKVVGTADYLAPEQSHDSSKVDRRADVYGLGGTFYYLLTGHPPFPEGSISERIRSHRTIMPSDITNDRRDCPGELTGICVKMLQKDPIFRYHSAIQVAEAIERWQALQ